MTRFLRTIHATLPDGPKLLDDPRFARLLNGEPTLERSLPLPSPAETQRLIDEVRETLRPGGLDDLQRALYRLLAAYPHGGPSDPRAYVAALAEDLSEFPADVVHEACRQHRRTSKWLPTAAELVQAATVLMRGRRTAICRLEQIEEARLAQAEDEAWRRRFLARRADPQLVEAAQRLHEGDAALAALLPASVTDEDSLAAFCSASGTTAAELLDRARRRPTPPDDAPAG